MFPSDNVLLAKSLEAKDKQADRQDTKATRFEITNWNGTIREAYKGIAAANTGVTKLIPTGELH